MSAKNSTVGMLLCVALSALSATSRAQERQANHEQELRAWTNCASGEACLEDGRCTLEAGECVVGGPTDCRGSETCTKHGRCYAVDGECTDGTRHRSPGAMAAGITLLSVGAGAAVAAIITGFSAINFGDPSSSPSGQQRTRGYAALGLLIGGLVLMPIGGVLLHHGKQRVSAEIGLAPTGGALALHF